MKLSRAAALAVTALLATGLSACGSSGEPGAPTSSNPPTRNASGEASTANPDAGDWQSVVEAARGEGSVVLSITGGTNFAALEAAFESTYPEIDLVVDATQSSKLLPRLDQENDIVKGGGTVQSSDVVLHTDQIWADQAVQAGASSKIRLSPEVEALWSGLPDAKDPYIKHPSYLLAAIGWNTDLHPGPITGIESIFAPELNGRVAFFAPALAPVLSKQYYDYQQRVGDGFLADLKAQNIQVMSAGAAAIVQSVVSGENLVAVGPNPATYLELIAQGAAVNYIVPEGSQVFATVGQVVAWSAHPNASNVLMDWLMSKEGQLALLKAQGATSALPGLSLDINGVSESGNLDRFEIFDQSEWTREREQAFLQEWADAGLITG